MTREAWAVLDIDQIIDSVVEGLSERLDAPVSGFVHGEFVRFTTPLLGTASAYVEFPVASLRWIIPQDLPLRLAPRLLGMVRQWQAANN